VTKHKSLEDYAARRFRFAGNALLEFSAPEYIYKDERDKLVRQLAPFVKVDPDLLRFDALGTAEQFRVINEIADVKRSESQIREIKRKARVDQLLDNALDAFRQQHYDKAEQVYQEILELDPENVMTWLNLGNVHASLQKISAAEEAYKKSIAINPYYLFGYIALAKLYISTGSSDRAKDLLLKTLAWQQTDKEVRLYLGIAHSMGKDLKNAFEQWNKALELDPQFVLVHYYMGVQYQNTDPALCKRHLNLFLGGAHRGGYDERLVLSAEKLLKKF